MFFKIAHSLSVCDSSVIQESKNGYIVFQNCFFSLRAVAVRYTLKARLVFFNTLLIEKDLLGRRGSINNFIYVIPRFIEQ